MSTETTPEETDTGGTSETNPQGSERLGTLGAGAAAAADVARLIRDESAVSEADLRVDVARQVMRYTQKDEEESVASKSVSTRGPLQIYRGGRTRTVHGNYTRRVDGDETVQAASLDERVHGGVDYKAKIESEAMVGGAYVNTVAGVYLRIAGWADYLAWGGWVEADVNRIEIAGVMIRSYMNYVHAAGVRVMAASRLVDDFLTRTENFGTLTESYGSRSHTGGPDGGTVLES